MERAMAKAELGTRAEAELNMGCEGGVEEGTG
jgi:hypothetical protein